MQPQRLPPGALTDIDKHPSPRRLRRGTQLIQVHPGTICGVHRTDGHRSCPRERDHNSAGFASVTVTPRCRCAANGKIKLVDSLCTVSTLVPSATLAATSPISWDTLVYGIGEKRSDTDNEVGRNGELGLKRTSLVGN